MPYEGIWQTASAGQDVFGQNIVTVRQWFNDVHFSELLTGKKKKKVVKLEWFSGMI